MKLRYQDMTGWLIMVRLDVATIEPAELVIGVVVFIGWPTHSTVPILKFRSAMPVPLILIYFTYRLILTS